jgi:predicted transcriptional regulator
MATIEITEFVILSILALSGYLAGLISMMLIMRYLRSNRERREIGRLYQERIGEYEKTLMDMMLRLNIIELRLRNKQISQDISHITYHNEEKEERREIRQVDNIEFKILDLLLKGAKTSREIEVSIGRSREHTARLMKRLYEKGYVIRDVSNKPYKYSITDIGKSILNQTEAV